jgi:hypothetical protein
VPDRELHRVEAVEDLRELRSGIATDDELAQPLPPVEVPVPHGQQAKIRERNRAARAPRLAAPEIPFEGSRKRPDARLVLLQRDESERQREQVDHDLRMPLVSEA